MNHESDLYLDDAQKKEILVGTDVFSGLSDEEIGLILPLCRTESFRRGERIIEENEAGDDLYILIEGEVSIQLEAITPHFDVAISKIPRGQILGELALIDNEPRSARATCVMDCKCIVISGAALRGIFDMNPVLGYKVMTNLAKTISARIRKTNRRLLNVVRTKLF